MASGKSTLGHALAKELKYEFLDTDVLIEKKYKRSISDIFKLNGEPKFREYETEVLKELAQKKNKIISCGGGIVIKPENRALLKKIGKVIFLEVEPKDVLARVKDYTARPLLNYPDPQKRLEVIEQLLEKRDNFYREAADLVFKTKTGQLANDIQKILKLAKE
jgi:shikimate kinase